MNATSSMHVHEKHATAAAISAQCLLSACVGRHHGAISVKRSKLSAARRAALSYRFLRSSFGIEANTHGSP